MILSGAGRGHAGAQRAPLTRAAGRSGRMDLQGRERAALVVMLVLIAVDIVTRWVFNFSFEVSDEVGGYMLVVITLRQPLRLPRQWQLP